MSLNTAGLRLDQAPPLAVPAAFFLAAPPFALAAGLWLAVAGDLLLVSRWLPQTLALVHLIALGFLSQVLCGALLQLPPVLAGAPVPRVLLVGRTAQVLLVGGTLLLCAGLAWGWGLPLTLGAGAAAAGLALLGGAVMIALVRGQGAGDTRLGLGLGLGALAVTAVLGLVLTGVLGGWARLSGLDAWVDLHLGWGLLGWAGLIIMGVGYQVVPMFHVTPPYPRWLRAAAVPTAAAGLVAALVLTAAGGVHLAPWGFALTAAVLGVFAVLTLDRQRRRQRPILDATLLHWRAAMLSGLAAALLWPLGARAETLGVLLLIGVGVGLPSGMLFKILPFLSWFHLQHRQLTARRFDVRVPHMQVLIPDGQARIQFGLHLAALVLLTAATLFPGAGLARPAGVLLAAAAGWLGFLLAQCWRRYAAVARSLGP